ncbi:non-ribosomal peptide synthetase [Streptomyces sp. NBC_01092]|uniref:non-ribosomal peptide synthetase n=1 Tax=Streptomyces sp. NBC_01092 TaxID=2903748 RepID=UPI00386EF373|nr:amino acid adenylation domain-containing protein [Streptomyces sp. NBC_01092]
MARVLTRLDPALPRGLDPLPVPLAVTAATGAVAFHYAAFVREVHLRVDLVDIARTADEAGGKTLAARTPVDPAECFTALTERIARNLTVPAPAAATATGGPAFRLTIGPGVTDTHGSPHTDGGWHLYLDPATGVVAAEADDEAACTALAEMFAELLRQSVARPERTVGEFTVIPPAHRDRVLRARNATDRTFPSDLTLHQVFRRQAAATPGREAVCTDDAALTYAELDESSERLAHALRRRLGDGRDQVVAVLTERSLDLPVALLGVLKAGYAYLPLDPQAPALRVQDIVRRSGARAVVGQAALTEGLDLPVPVLAPDAPEVTEGPAPRPLTDRATPDDLAYVIYTSGSTGAPKGVMVEHRSVVNRLCWMQRAYPIGPDDTLIQKTPAIFDVSVWELFWWMFTGSRMYLPAPGAERFPLALTEAVERHRVTVMHFVPSMLNVFLAEVERARTAGALSALRVVFSSGETLTGHMVDAFHATLGAPNGTRLANLYGPTETTVDSTAFDCPPGAPGARVPIGRPIDNTRLYVLRHGRPLPEGVYGTLHVAGAGVARGYLGDEELTSRRFVPEYGRPGERMYDTGDIARLLPSGDVDFLGREDHQVKIRGIRIDLQEIENVLLEAPGVMECAVHLDEPGPALAVLRAAVTGTDELDRAALRRHVAERLPAYMVPATYDRHAGLPRTSSGKIDRRLLAEDPRTQARGVRL